MANISTYRQLSELIQTQHYNGFASPNAEIAQPHIAQIIATKIAKKAVITARNNGFESDTVYANDQFVSVYYSITLKTNTTTQDKYITLPATPAGLSKNTEIVQVSFTGAPNIHVIPCLQKDTFAESLLPPLPGSIVLYKIETGNIVFPGLPKIINSPVNVKMIGAISGPNLMDSLLNVPKDVEDDIRMEILQELAQEYGVKPDKIQPEAVE